MPEMRVLLVDDEVDFIQTLSKRLEIRALKADIACAGQKAISIAQEQEPDVVVLDLKMPGMDGIEVLRLMKQAYPCIQVIILTADGTEKDIREAEKLGAFDFLKKPVEIEMLLNEIRAAYKKKLELTMPAFTFTKEGDLQCEKL